MDQITEKKQSLVRKLIPLVYVNTIIWMIAIIALVILLGRYPGIKGFFVIFAGGIGISISILSVLFKNR